VREGEHLGQQIVLVIIFQVVDRIDGFKVLGAKLLDLVEHLLIIKVTTPE
jgi:hypothetical protein